MRVIFFILTIGTLFPSCSTKDEETKVSNFSFYLPEPDLYITTSKRIGGTFYVTFSKTDSLSSVSDSVDYIECQTEDQTLVIVFDPKSKNDIHFMYPYVSKTHKNNLNLVKMNPNDFKKKFYHLGAETAPDTLRSPYKELFILPMPYRIVFQGDTAFANQKTLKEGDLSGGW